MITPGRLDIAADRWVACVRTLAFIGVSLLGATYAAHVRLKPDVPGTPLIALTTTAGAGDEGIRTVYTGTDTVTNHIAAGRLSEIPEGMTGASNLTLSLVAIQILEATMEGLPFPDERGEDPVFYWDLHITPSGGVKDKYLGGMFVVRAGVTQ